MSKKYQDPRRNIVKFEIEDIHEATEPAPIQPVKQEELRDVEIEGMPSARKRSPDEEPTMKIVVWERRTSGFIANIRRWLFGKKGR